MTTDIDGYFHFFLFESIANLFVPSSFLHDIRADRMDLIFA